MNILLFSNKWCIFFKKNRGIFRAHELVFLKKFSNKKIYGNKTDELSFQDKKKLDLLKKVILILKISWFDS